MLERAVVTLETERIKGSNPRCLWWCCWWWWKTRRLHLSPMYFYWITSVIGHKQWRFDSPQRKHVPRSASNSSVFISSISKKAGPWIRFIIQDHLCGYHSIVGPPGCRDYFQTLVNSGDSKVAEWCLKSREKCWYSSRTSFFFHPLNKYSGKGRCSLNTPRQLSVAGTEWLESNSNSSLHAGFQTQPWLFHFQDALLWKGNKMRLLRVYSSVCLLPPEIRRKIKGKVHLRTCHEGLEGM